MAEKGTDHSLTYPILRDEGRYGSSFCRTVPYFHYAFMLISFIILSTAEMLLGVYVLRSVHCQRHLTHSSLFCLTADMLSGASSRFEEKLPTVHQISGIKITDNDALSILTIEYGTSTLFQFLFF